MKPDGAVGALLVLMGCAHASSVQKSASPCTGEAREPAPAHVSEVVEDARRTLKKWGLAYCLNKYLPSAKKEAGRAEGGYFELGNHEEEQVYDNVRHFFDERYRQDTRVSQIDGKPNPLIHCLDIYETKDYDLLIKQQDKYINLERDPMWLSGSGP